MMEEAGAVGAAWSAARGWLTPAVLFVAMNLVIATIVVASRLMSPAAPGGGGDDDEAAGEPRALRLLRAPSFLAADRLRSSFSFSRLGLAPDHAQQVVQPQPLSGDDGAPDPDLEPSLLLQQQQQPAAEANPQLEDQHQRDEARVERSGRSEAAALAEEPDSRRRLRARRAAAEELDGLGGEEAAAVEVDARADDFIRRFREQLRLQRLDSILRYRDRDSLRRTGTA